MINLQPVVFKGAVDGFWGNAHDLYIVVAKNGTNGRGVAYIAIAYIPGLYVLSIAKGRKTDHGHAGRVKVIRERLVVQPYLHKHAK